MSLLWRRWRPTATKTLWMLLTSPLGYENVYILNDLTKIFRSFVPSHLESLGTLSGLATDQRQLAQAPRTSSELILGGPFGFQEMSGQALFFKLVLTSRKPSAPPFFLPLHNFPPGRSCGRSQGLKSSCGSGRSLATS